jgi:exodeoxyribonuclease III
MLRIVSLNLNGIRSAERKGFLPWMAKHKPDMLCVQEIKAQHTDMTAEMLAPAGYHGHFHYAEKKGYSGGKNRIRCERVRRRRALRARGFRHIIQ